MSNYCVYKHTTPSGKTYIGITSKPVNQRWLNGKVYRKNDHFWNAIKKYGWDNIKHEILVAGLSKAEASAAEKMYIALFHSHEIKHGYNLTEGGETGIVHTPESRRKLSDSRKGQRYNIGNSYKTITPYLQKGFRTSKCKANTPIRYGRKCCEAMGKSLRGFGTLL